MALRHQENLILNLVLDTKDLQTLKEAFNLTATSYGFATH